MGDALGGALGGDRRDFGDDLVQALGLGFHFFADQHDGGAHQRGGAQGDVGGAAAHDLDEVVVLAAGGRVLGDVADGLGVDLGRRVEAEGDGQMLANLQITVDGLGHADDLHAAAIRVDAREELLGQESGVRVGVVAADDDDGIDRLFLADLLDQLELLVRFDLGAIAAQEIKAAQVQNGLGAFLGDLEGLALQQTAGARLHAKQLVRGAKRLVEAHQHVVAAGRGAAGKEHQHLLAADGGHAALDGFQHLVGVVLHGVGEVGRDLLGIGRDQRLARFLEGSGLNGLAVQEDIRHRDGQRAQEALEGRIPLFGVVFRKDGLVHGRSPSGCFVDDGSASWLQETPRRYSCASHRFGARHRSSRIAESGPRIPLWMGGWAKTADSPSPDPAGSRMGSRKQGRRNYLAAGQA